MPRQSEKLQEQLKKKEWKAYALQYGQKETEEIISALLSLGNTKPSEEAKKALKSAEKLFVILEQGKDLALDVTSAPEDPESKDEVLRSLWVRYNKERGMGPTTVAQLAAENLSDLEQIYFLRKAFKQDLFIGFTHIGGDVLDSQIFKMMSPKEYIKGLPKYSSLFTYLPMEDTRFQLPFLVNADFVPSSDRQNIQGDNLWNKYIMIKVAEKHVATLSHYALEFIKDNNQFSSYLSLLLKEPLPEDDTAQQIIDSYNEKYIEQLNIVSIVVNDKNQSQLLSETIFDTSGLIELFGHEIFYEIIETQKRLPHSNLDASYLKEYGYLDIEVINLEELANSITPEICERFGVIIAEKSIYEKPELLKWLDKLVGYMPSNFGKIPFIVHNNSLFSFERLVAEDNAWLINKNTNNYEELFKGLGYHTINLNLDEYSNINTFLLSYSGYINDKTLAYERIVTNSNLSSLDVSLKLNLVDFLQTSEFMVGIGETKYFGELKLFVDKNGIARPLRQLLNRNINKEVNSIQPFKIIEQEFLKLSDELQRELISKEEVFTSFILNTELFDEWSQQFNSQNIDNYIGGIKTIYSWVENEDEISSSDWASIPWLYVDDELRFTNTDKVFWSSAFHNLSNENYETVKSILQIAELRTLPIQDCGEIIQTFKLKTDDSSGIDWTKVNNLELLSANTFLDWLENDGVFNEATEMYGCPEIINTDQGSQYTAEVFTKAVLSKGLKLSMDGKGRATDNAFIERLWRSVKYEKIYLNPPKDGLHLNRMLNEYFHYYNTERSHSRIADHYPDDIYFSAKQIHEKAA